MSPVGRETTGRRPNILLVCTDQHRFDVIGTHPGSAATTPHLQDLGASGAVFDACYAPSPVCSPSRASMLTGQYPRRHGLWANGVALPDDGHLVSRQLADAGYRCGLIGKLHLSTAFSGRTEQRPDDGFEVFRWAHDPFHGSPENAYHAWLRRRHPDQWARASADVVTPDATNFAHADTAFDAMPTEAHYSTWVAEEAEDFLASTPRDRPFFLLANFYDPHHPFVVPPEYLTEYPPGSVPPPVGGPEELAAKPEVQASASRASYNGHGPSFTDFDAEGIDELRRTYHAMVSQVDDCVGRVLRALREQGLAEDTLVIFTSDHGEMLGDHALLLKGPMMYEAAVHVPMLVSWPGRVEPGTRVRGLVGVHDAARTLRAAAGLPDDPLDQGLDLVAVARGETPARDWALSEYRDSGYGYDPQVLTTMLRTGRHKLVLWHGRPATERDPSGELYDLDDDPDELRNLWDYPASAGLKTRLLVQLLDVGVSLEDRSAPREHPW